MFLGTALGPCIGCIVHMLHPDLLSRSLVFAGMGLVLSSKIIKSRFECLRSVCPSFVALRPYSRKCDESIDTKAKSVFAVTPEHIDMERAWVSNSTIELP